MKKETLILAFVLISAISCQSKDMKNNNKKDPKISGQSIIVSNKILLVDTMKTVNDNFIYRVLDNDLTLPHISSVYSPITQSSSTSVNSHNSIVTDTLITLTKSTDTFSFLKANNKIFHSSSHIETNTITIDTNIVIGATKSVFATKFGIASVPDVLTVGDSESANKFTFTFNSSGTLIKIDYLLLYID